MVDLDSERREISWAPPHRQLFSRPRYFHPRSSTAGDGYAADAARSNLGSMNEAFLEKVTRPDGHLGFREP